ncbi:probable purine permease 11 [Typha angustifolia]|uniref:probable purine permease 11 n=1 Tax=Typha angustifolia TaxID=59011 RepID=UPI003C2B4B6E
MGDAQDFQLHIGGYPSHGIEGPNGSAPQKDHAVVNHLNITTPPIQTASVFQHWKWWWLVLLNIFFLLSGQTVATLLGRLYYDQGGNSKWMATIVQSAGYPLLVIPLFLYPSPSTSTTAVAVPRPPLVKITAIYTALGLLIAGDNLMYSYGLLYLPVSTYSLICATQLAFNAVFSYFLNNQKFTSLIFNSVVLLTFSAALLGVNSDSGDSTDGLKTKYALGFMLTLGASALFSLILSLMQLTFQKVIRTETFSVVLEMQIWCSLVAAGASVLGLFASGECRSLGAEMDGYGKGKVSYVMTLVWTAIAWQVAAVGTVGLIFVVSSLFSNVISTLALPLVPIFAVICFHDKMDGVKVVAMLIAVWGFLSYIYQHYLDDLRAKKKAKQCASK